LNISIPANTPSEYTYNIEKYTRIKDERYEINLQASFQDNPTVQYEGKILYLTELIPLLVQIVGGNR
jgi:hypothetical protein